MLGYAVGACRPGRRAGLDELPTGDLGRYHPDDEVYEIVGRRARFVKPSGCADLDVVEADLKPPAS